MNKGVTSHNNCLYLVKIKFNSNHLAESLGVDPTHSVNVVTNEEQ